MIDWRDFWDISKGCIIDESFPMYVFDSNMQMMVDAIFEDDASYRLQVGFFKALKKCIDGEEGFEEFCKSNFSHADYDNDSTIAFFVEGEEKPIVVLEVRGFGFLQYESENPMEVQASLGSYIASKTGLNRI